MKSKKNPNAVAASEESMEHVPARQLRNYKQLGNVDAIQVAKIAATLLPPAGNEIEAIRKTYRLLDIAEHCNLSLKNEASVDAGIRRYQEGVKADDDFYATYAALKEAPNVGHKQSIEDRLLQHGPEERKPVDFDKELEEIIPLPKTIQNKPAERRSKLRQFLKEWLQENRQKLNEQERTLEAMNWIEQMERDGIEPKFRAFIKVKFPSWWKEARARDNSARGKRGKGVKKGEGKSKQVKSTSSKRQARPPAAEGLGPIQELIEENKIRSRKTRPDLT
jgi:hypothetical protein